MHRPSDDLLKEEFTQCDDIKFVKSGAQKIVYRIREKGQTWALKLVPLLSETQDDPQAEQDQRETEGRLDREIRIQRDATVRSLVHLGPHPLRRLRMGDSSYLCYTEQFVEGNDLSQLIAEGSCPDLGELVRLGLCILEAISFLWSKRWIHRDIKPGNIMRTTGKVTGFLLLDVGYALALGETSLTRKGIFPGTLEYMSPEQLDVSKKRSLDFRSDLYSLGITMLEYSCGKHPYVRKKDTTAEIADAILRKKPLPLHCQRSDFPRDFCSLVDRFVLKQRHLRPGRIREICEQLSQVSV